MSHFKQKETEAVGAGSIHSLDSIISNGPYKINCSRAAHVLQHPGATIHGDVSQQAALLASLLAIHCAQSVSIGWFLLQKDVGGRQQLWHCPGLPPQPPQLPCWSPCSSLSSTSTGTHGSVGYFQQLPLPVHRE